MIFTLWILHPVTLPVCGPNKFYLTGKFTLYFPYILLLSALVLAGIERLFKKVFKTNVQVEGFYSLLLTAKKIEVSTKISNIKLYCGYI